MGKVTIVNFKLYLLFIFLLYSNIAAGPWPGQLPGTEIGSGLPTGYEPSGAVWHSRLNKFFTVWDNGMVSMLRSDGSDITNWNVSGDLEAICVADPNSDFVYVGVERPADGITEFNISTGQVTRFFDLTPWMQSNDPNLGLEALSFVPDTSNPEGGFFYAGLQENSNIYIFQLPIKSSTTDTNVTFIDMINPVGGRPNLSGLDYERKIGILYAIWSYGQNKIRAMEVNGSNIVEWDLVGDSQEGIALWEGDSTGSGQIFIAEDTGEVWRYDFNSILNISIIGSGSVSTNPYPPSYYGTFDTLTAIPDSGYQFYEWGGDLSGNENPETLLMDYDKDVTATFTEVTIDENKPQAKICSLHIPNPVRGSVVITYQVTTKDKIILRVFDISGRVVKNFGFLDNQPGVHKVLWNCCDDSGYPLCDNIYFCRFETGRSAVTKKVIIFH